MKGIYRVKKLEKLLIAMLASLLGAPLLFLYAFFF